MQHRRTDQEPHDPGAAPAAVVAPDEGEHQHEQGDGEGDEAHPVDAARGRVRDSWILVRVMTMATTPMGTLTKKIHRQPTPLVMAPPTSGPTATAPPITAP